MRGVLSANRCSCLTESLILRSRKQLQICFSPFLFRMGADCFNLCPSPSVYPSAKSGVIVLRYSMGSVNFLN